MKCGDEKKLILLFSDRRKWGQLRANVKLQIFLVPLGSFHETSKSEKADSILMESLEVWKSKIMGKCKECDTMIILTQLDVFETKIRSGVALKEDAFFESMDVVGSEDDEKQGGDPEFLVTQGLIRFRRGFLL